MAKLESQDDMMGETDGTTSEDIDQINSVDTGSSENAHLEDGELVLDKQDRTEPDNTGVDILATQEFVQVELLNIETVYPDVFPKLVLRAVDDPNLEFAFSVGSFEAVAIANAWRNLKSPRPLTHDLFANVLYEIGATVEEVRIFPKEQGNYVGQILITSSKGPKMFDCRPSDAIALALRQKLTVPIMCAPQLFED